MNKSPFDLQNIDIVMTNMTAKNTREILEKISHEISEYSSLTATTIFTRLLQKEKDQSSGTGNGVAIPHARMMNLDAPISMLITLTNAADFGAPDNMPVDLIYVLLSPRADGPLHLQRLSAISRILKNDDFCDNLRNAKNADAVSALIAAGPLSLSRAA